MTPSSYPDLRRYNVLLFKCCLIVFLVIIPVLLGNSNPGPSIIDSQRKDFELNYYSLAQIFPDIDSRYEQPSRPKGIKNQKTVVILLNVIHNKLCTSGLKQNTHYDNAFSPEYITSYAFKAKVLLLDMPPPSHPV